MILQTPPAEAFYQEQSVQESIKAWHTFLKSFDWKNVLSKSTPKEVGCGLIYELPNFLDRPHESFAIADMRTIPFAEPHYHPDGVTEIYFVLQGTATIVIAGKEVDVQSGDVIIIEPNKAHFTIPDTAFIIAALNIPAFNPDHYIPLTEDNELVGFSRKQFEELIAQR